MYRNRGRPLNLDAFDIGDIVKHYRSDVVYRVTGERWRSECVNVLNLATGVKEIADVFAYLDEGGVSVTRGRALDFGCGAGRLSQALAGDVEEVVGGEMWYWRVGRGEEENGGGVDSGCGEEKQAEVVRARGAKEGR